MGVYDRYKRDPNGIRKMVELIEATPITRRQRMIEIGMEEDSRYTKYLLQFVLTFEDVLSLPDMELAELISSAPARIVALSIAKAPVEIRDRFKKNTVSSAMAELRDAMDTIGTDPPLRDIGGAQLKMIELTRKLEKAGKIRTKQVPQGGVIQDDRFDENSSENPNED